MSVWGLRLACLTYWRKDSPIVACSLFGPPAAYISTSLRYVGQNSKRHTNAMQQGSITCAVESAEDTVPAKSRQQ